MENAAMSLLAVFLCGYAANADSMKDALRSFNAPSHRCQLVADEGGVRYIDDSKGTNVASTVAALSSLSGKKVIILGGKGKGEDYAPLAETVKKEALAAVVLGEERAKITAALARVGFEAVLQAADMEDAVRQAAQFPGAEVVLLSPACTSWDMYPNYKKRGEHFREIVCRLKDGDNV